jgi:hypothetical protein
MCRGGRTGLACLGPPVLQVGREAAAGFLKTRSLAIYLIGGF